MSQKSQEKARQKSQVSRCHFPYSKCDFGKDGSKMRSMTRLNFGKSVMQMMNNHQICGYTWIHYFQTNPDYTFGQDGTSPALKNPLWLDLEVGNLHLRVSFLLPEMGSGWWLWDVDGCCGGPISNTRPGKHTKSYGKSPFLMGKSTVNGHFQ